MPPEADGSGDARELPRRSDAMRPPGVDQHGADRTPNERADHEGPVPQADRGKCERRARAEQGLGAVRPSQPPEVQVPGEKSARHDLQSGREERETASDDDPAHCRLAVESGDRGGQESRERDQARAQQEGEASQARDLALRQVASSDDRGSEPELVHELCEAEINHRHADEAVVCGGEQSGDDEGGHPAQDLGAPSHRPGPRDSPDEGPIELAAAAAGGGARSRQREVRRCRDRGGSGVAQGASPRGSPTTAPAASGVVRVG